MQKMRDLIEHAIDVKLIVKTQLTSTNIVDADDVKYHRLGSNLLIFSHDEVLEEMRLISLEIWLLKSESPETKHSIFFLFILLLGYRWFPLDSQTKTVTTKEQYLKWSFRPTSRREKQNLNEAISMGKNYNLRVELNLINQFILEQKYKLHV